VVLADDQASVLLPVGNALGPQRAAVAVPAPFEAIADFAGLLGCVKKFV
jgi:hypothetical protein